MSPQGKRARPRPAPEPAPRRSAKGIGLVAFGVLLIALFAIVAVAQGLGDPSVPDDAIAVVEDAPDGTVTKEEYDRALVQTAARQGLKEVPESTDPQYQALADAAQSDLLLARWVRGEASERGIELTEREVDDELEKVKTQQFGSEEAFQKFLKQAGFSEEEARQRIELQLLSDRIQTAVLPKDPDVTAEEVQRFYDANVSQFEQPEARDVRVILTENEDEADQALAALESDDSPESFEEVAKKYSIDEATKSTGGLRQGVVAGQSEPALDEQIFSSAEGELVGPFKTDAGYYVIQVEKVTPATTQSLTDVSEQVRQTLAAQRQQEVATQFQTNFQTKWIARTFCADDYRIERCANAPAPPPTCTQELIDTTGCDAFVPSRGVMNPGGAGVFGSPPPVVRPQGPQGPAPAAAGALPPGLVPGGAVPPGSVPPGSVPPGSVPPGSVPPGSVPPGTPPPGG